MGKPISGMDSLAVTGYAEFAGWNGEIGIHDRDCEHTVLHRSGGSEVETQRRLVGGRAAGRMIVHLDHNARVGLEQQADSRIQRLHASAWNPRAQIVAGAKRLQPDAAEAIVTGQAILTFVLQRFTGFIHEDQNVMDLLRRARQRLRRIEIDILGHAAGHGEAAEVSGLVANGEYCGRLRMMSGCPNCQGLLFTGSGGGASLGSPSGAPASTQSRIVWRSASVSP